MSRPLPRLLPLVLIALAACVPSEDGSSLDPLGSTGAGTGGSPASFGTGGAASSSGGATGSGGFTGSGGALGTGGSIVVSSGGVMGSGGKVGTGGTVVTGPDAGAGGGQVGGPDGGVPGTGGRMAATDAGAGTASVCTSKMTYMGGNGQTMRPGNDCTGCHNFAIAGTVYPTANEPDNCIGVNGTTGVKVVITGMNGTVLTLTPNTSGNFYSNTKVTPPFTVKLTNGAKTRMMVSSQTVGGCNSCHTSTGANGAPGRVMSP